MLCRSHVDELDHPFVDCISFLPNFIYCSITTVIFGGGRRAGGAWAVSTMVSAAIGSNPFQTLEVEQHNMVPITDCFTQLFSASINLKYLAIATVPLFRLIKTVFVAGYTSTWTLYTIHFPLSLVRYSPTRSPTLTSPWPCARKIWNTFCLHLFQSCPSMYNPGHALLAQLVVVVEQPSQSCLL